MAGAVAADSSPSAAAPANHAARRQFLTDACVAEGPPLNTSFGDTHFTSWLFQPGRRDTDLAFVVAFDPDTNLGVARSESTGANYGFEIIEDSRRWMAGRERFEVRVRRFEIDTVACDGVIWADRGDPIDSRCKVAVR